MKTYETKQEAIIDAINTTHKWSKKALKEKAFNDNVTHIHGSYFVNVAVSLTTGDLRLLPKTNREIKGKTKFPSMCGRLSAYINSVGDEFKELHGNDALKRFGPNSKFSHLGVRKDLTIEFTKFMIAKLNELK